MKPLTVLSLFDGISCGQVALHRAGIAVGKYYASEIDKHAIKITQKNFPETVQLGDVTQIDFSKFAGKIDLIMGGSPCQDLSIAGKRQGLSGDRSGLFYKFVEAIEVIKPKYYLLENNVGMPDEAYEEISQLMGCYPIMINSALVSAQNRRRYYWFNWGDKECDLFGFPTCNIAQPEDKGILLQDVLDDGMAYSKKAHCLTANYNGATFLHNLDYSIRSQKAIPAIYQLLHGYNPGGIKKDKVPTLTTSSWQNNNFLITKPERLKQYEKSNGQAQRVYSVRGKAVSMIANGGGKVVKPDYTRLTYRMEIMSSVNFLRSSVNGYKLCRTIIPAAWQIRNDTRLWVTAGRWM